MKLIILIYNKLYNVLWKKIIFRKCRKKLTEEERAERAELKIKFKNLSTDLSGAAREKFEDIERRRETND